MNNKELVKFLPKVVGLLSPDNSFFDKEYYIWSLEEALQNIEEYELFMAQFPHLLPEVPFVVKLVYGDTPEVRKCLAVAEKNYHELILSGRIDPENTKKIVFESLIESIETGVPFIIISLRFIHERDRLHRIFKQNYGYTVPKDICLREILSGIYSKLNLPTLFFQQVTR